MRSSVVFVAVLGFAWTAIGAPPARAAATPPGRPAVLPSQPPSGQVPKTRSKRPPPVPLFSAPLQPPSVPGSIAPSAPPPVEPSVPQDATLPPIRIPASDSPPWLIYTQPPSLVTDPRTGPDPSQRLGSGKPPITFGRCVGFVDSTLPGPVIVVDRPPDMTLGLFYKLYVSSNVNIAIIYSMSHKGDVLHSVQVDGNEGVLLVDLAFKLPAKFAIVLGPQDYSGWTGVITAIRVWEQDRSRLWA